MKGSVVYMITNSAEYATRVENRMVNPSTEPIVEIDLDSRIIDTQSVLDAFVTVQNDNNAETIYFSIDRYFDDVDLTTKSILIKSLNANGRLYYDDAVDIYTKTIDGKEKIIFGWTIHDFTTLYQGEILIQVMVYSYREGTNYFDYVLNTRTKDKIVYDGLADYNRF